ncbi:unnamed protein product [Porites lobata]|uniref:Uncharacterized protein n=1 Tax=Porites lobata TaxID=104759 RepID=A0ABN8NRW1_9CNID|nr:unnamed protein product [Porites lobata]
MLSTPFHSGARQCSLTGVNGHRGDPAEMVNMSMTVTLDQLRFQKDENNRLTLLIDFKKEKQDQGNRCYRCPFHVTPLSDGSPYAAANNKPLNDLTSLFKRVVVKAGFDPRRITHHCNRSGFATTFIINQMVDNNGVFPREAISTLCRLAGGHLGPLYQGGNGEALRHKYLHLQGSKNRENFILEGHQNKCQLPPR